MKEKFVDELPKCDNFVHNIMPVPECKEEAIYDAPTWSGTWGYFCQACADAMECKTSIGTKFVLRKPLTKDIKEKAKQVKSNVIPVAIEPSIEDDPDYWEGVIFDGVREVHCPICHEPRSVEPDAAYIIKCESCNVRYKVKGMI